MDSQIIFNLVFAVAGFFGGWILNRLDRTIDKLDSDVRVMATVFISREEHREDTREIKAMLAKIFDRLDLKVDK